MSNEKLIIPDKLKVGFQNRDGTYTGKLAYVIYIDAKGVVRKEKSWESWRDKKIKPVEIDNTPTEGFVLNKKVGGYKSEWNYRDAHVRVYDPRDFEFEISVPNLLFILTQCDCSRGKGLEGKFVYAWEGTELVLLPVSCEEYTKSKVFTDLQTKAVKGKELIPGASYVTKKQETLVYLGRFEYHWLTSARYSSRGTLQKAQVAKRYVFWNPAINEYRKKPEGFVYMDTPKNIAQLNSDVIVDDFADLVEKYHKSEHGTKVVGLFLKEVKPKKEDEDRESYYVEKDGEFLQYTASRSWQDKKINYLQTSEKFFMKDGVLHEQYWHGTVYPAGTPKPSYGYGYSYGRDRDAEQTIDWAEPNHMRLYAELESGQKYRIEYNTFTKD